MNLLVFMLGVDWCGQKSSQTNAKRNKCYILLLTILCEISVVSVTSRYRFCTYCNCNLSSLIWLCCAAVWLLALLKCAHFDVNLWGFGFNDEINRNTKKSRIVSKSFYFLFFVFLRWFSFCVTETNKKKKHSLIICTKITLAETQNLSVTNSYVDSM